MQRLRYGDAPMNAYRKKNFLNGPGKVCKALDLTTAQNRLDLEGDTLFLCDSMADVGLKDLPIEPEHLCSGPRIGVDYAEEARDFPWRFWLEKTADKERFKMYLFDMDGTLIDSNSVWKDVDREFLTRRGLPYTKAYYEGVAHTIFPLAAKFTKEFCHLPESEEAIMAEWMDLAKDAYAHVTVKPGVRAFLKQCRSENRRMALVTSSVPVHCRTAMEKLDLMKYFESVTFAQELGIEKKNRELWLHVAERCGVEPQSCTLFDDSLAACKGARSAKMRVVGVYDGFFAADEKEMRAFCDVYIKSFEELLWKPEYRKG